jgi:hypothetical protein
MKLLKRVLYWEAGLLAVSGLLSASFPRWLLETVFAQPPSPEVWVRVAGVQAMGFAMLAVVIGHRIEQLWWASWAYVITGALVAAVTAGYALFGLSDGTSAVLWWLMAVESVVVTAGLLVGLAQTGTERDPNAPGSGTG